MDEMTMLDRLRQEIPTPDDLRAEERVLLAEIRRAEPVPDTGRGRPLPRLVPRPRRRLIFAVACGLAGVLVLALTRGDDITGTPPGERTPAAVEVLELAARTVETHPVPEPGPRQWVYELFVSSIGPAGRRDLGDETWVRFDGKEWARIGKDGALRRERGKPDDGRTPRQAWTYLESLPDDPAKLLSRIRRDIGRGVFNGVAPRIAGADEFYVIQELIRTIVVMPSDRRATLFRALAKIPGIQVRENMADAIGRRGIGVFLPARLLPDPVAAIFDPTTFAYLGSREIIDSGGRRLLPIQEGRKVFPSPAGGDIGGDAGGDVGGDAGGEGGTPPPAAARDPLVTARVGSGVVDRPGERP